ncbi:MAG: hypothetical protein HY240_09145 [Actinobacteria bacterium]|nr:hypothetical protein [Actinomycetota bacterium]
MISGAFSHFKENWKTLIGFSAVFFVALIAIGLVLGLLLIGLVLRPLFHSGTNPGMLGAGFLGTFLLMYGLVFVAAMVMTGALTRLVATELAGVPITISQSLSYGMRRLGSILWVSLLVFFAVLAAELVGLLLVLAVRILILPVYLATSALGLTLSMAVPVLVVEGARGPQALTRSWQLVSKHFWHVLGTFALMYLLVFAIFVGVMIVSVVLKGFGILIGLGLDLALFPILSLVIVGLYMNLRVKSGGLTLEMVRTELSGSA